jgi:hypothetical protein
MGAIILGMIGVFFTLLGLIPFLGIMNFFSIPLLVIGLLCGIIGICKKPKEKRGPSIAGLIICILFLAVAGWRVYIGWSSTKKLIDPNTLEKLQDTSDSLNKFSDSLNNLSDLLDDSNK